MEGLIVLLVIGTFVAVIVSAVNSSQRDADVEQRLELVDAPAKDDFFGTADDWGLGHERMWDELFAFGFTNIGGSPKIGNLSWEHLAQREGRELLVARETFTTESGSGSSKSSTTHTFYLVAIRVPLPGQWFTNGGDEDGDLLPTEVRDLLVDAQQADRTRAIMLHHGILALRLHEQEYIEDGIDLAVQVADLVDAPAVEAQTPAPAPAAEAEPAPAPGVEWSQWQQPPREGGA